MFNERIAKKIQDRITFITRPRSLEIQKKCLKLPPVIFEPILRVQFVEQKV